MKRAGPRTKSLPVVIALDQPWKESKIWLSRLKAMVWGFKVGSILFTERGPKVIEDVQKAGFKIFLDLKFHDIPHTVQKAVRQSFSWGVDLLTVHACGGKAMLEVAASEQKAKQSVIAVTVLTSFDQSDLKDIGVSRSLDEQVVALGDLAIKSGVRGLVCSPLEVQSLRLRHANSFLVTPGVRFDAGAVQDQKRTQTLKATLQNGASLAVVGRAITDSKDWESVVCKMNQSII